MKNDLGTRGVKVPGPMAAVALTVRAPQAPRLAAPGPTAAAVALTLRAPPAQQ